MVSTLSIGFCTDVTAFIVLLLVYLGADQTVFLPIAEVLVVTAFGAVVSLVAVYCVG